MQGSNEDQTRDIGDIFKEHGKLKRSCTEPVKRALVSNTLSITFVVLKSQHGKKNILLVILAHLVGNIKALACHVRASPTELQRAAL